MPRPKVSVVVPIYGVEKYLRQCLDSILVQTLKEIEIVLVDDGSPDMCPQIVDEYAAKDDRIIALHQPNGGYGVAVNNGIAAATGVYIGIVESDDWIEPTMYEKLYDNAVRNRSDVVKCSFYLYNPEKELPRQNIPWKTEQIDLFDAPPETFTLVEYPDIVLFHASVWASLYRADFIKDIKMIETEGASYQDFPFMCEVMSTAKRISVEKDYLLHYRFTAEGNSASQRGGRCILMATHCAKGIEVLRKKGVLDHCREEIYCHAYAACVGFFRMIQPDLKKQYFDEFHRLFAPLAGDETFRFKHFSKNNIPEIKAIIAGDFNRAVHTVQYNWWSIRHAILSFRISFSRNRKKKCLRLVILGLQIAGNKDDINYNIPCWKRIILKK